MLCRLLRTVLAAALALPVAVMAGGPVVGVLSSYMVLTPLAGDDFNRADGALGSNWTNVNNSFTIVSNQAKPGTNTAFNTAKFSAVTFPNDQWASAIVSGLSTVNAPGVAVRLGATGGYVGYKTYGGGGGWTIARIGGSGTNTDVTSGGTAVSNGDKLTLTAVGTTIALYKNDVLLGSITDSNFTSGTPGVWSYTEDQGDRLDNFQAGAMH